MIEWLKEWLKEWLGWVIAGLLGIPAAVYYSLHLKSRWEEARGRQRNAKVEAKNVLKNAIDAAKDYNFNSWQFAQLISNPFTPKELRKRLEELESLSRECERWRYEAWQIVSHGVRLASKDFKDLDDSFTLFYGRLPSVFDGVERSGSKSANIYRAIYRGNLTFELARDSVLRDNWDTSIKLKDETSVEEKEVRLKDVVESQAFREFVETLKALESREPMKMLRDAQARFIDKAQAVIREV